MSNGWLNLVAARTVNRLRTDQGHASTLLIKAAGIFFSLPLLLATQTSLAQQFEVGKIPSLPGALNPQLDGYEAGCRILSCGGQGNGMHQGHPASIVILRWTWPEETELKPYYATGFVSINNCTSNNSTCKEGADALYPTVLMKLWSCPPGFDSNPANNMTCIRRLIDPGKNNECDIPTSGSCVAGNPINFFTGSKLQKEVDFSEKGTKLQFTRYYTSGNTGLEAGSALGAEWRHSYMRSIRANLTQGTKTALLSRPSGNSYIFKDDGNGVWQAESDVRYRLQEVRTDGALVNWLVYAPDQTIEEFDAAGNLQKISYPDGDFVKFNYVGGQISKANDAPGRSLTFSYKNGRLDFITLP